ncbi:helix-turn-helix transcriptional regulator [Roseateles sp. DAIF2]|uniref:helix-turn-helix domain-containing protein n=1 Tax=Roseateles sp. DAIF2 TaxID=2714952 RepID=UPI0018A326DE|nr:AraC family transcriptional regulator [Roseateles sp. DAIF2]QPF71594.1 helix-turn-helix transcriptional regulator [Roseateles sp. DAIF2]
MQLSPFPVATTGGLIEGLAVLRNAARSTRTLVAESRLSVGIRLAGAASLWRDGAWVPLPDQTLTGLHCGSRIVRTEAGSLLVLAHLHPAAAVALGIVEAARLVEQTLDLARLWPVAEIEALRERLRAAPDDGARAAALERHLAERLAQGAAPEPAIVAAVDRLRAEPAELRIADLARELGLSTDTLGRRFAAGVGVSPKRFARAARLRSAVLSYGAGTTLTEVAMLAGYYDQSHFVREMRAATGLAPQGLLPGLAYC